MPRTLINDLVNKWCGEVVFGTSFVQIVKFSADMDGALFFEDGNWVGHPSGVFYGINETNLLELIDFGFDSLMSRRMNGYHLLTNWIGIRSCVDMVFDNDWIEFGNF